MRAAILGGTAARAVAATASAGSSTDVDIGGSDMCTRTERPQCRSGCLFSGVVAATQRRAQEEEAALYTRASCKRSGDQGKPGKPGHRNIGRGK